MRLSSRPSSIYDILARNQLPDIAEEKKISSFYLPNDTFKVIHITRLDTSQNYSSSTLGHGGKFVRVVKGLPGSRGAPVQVPRPAAVDKLLTL